MQINNYPSPDMLQKYLYKYKANPTRLSSPYKKENFNDRFIV